MTRHALAPDLSDPAGYLFRRGPVRIVFFFENTCALLQGAAEPFAAHPFTQRLRDEGAALALPYQTVHRLDQVVRQYNVRSHSPHMIP